MGDVVTNMPSQDEIQYQAAKKEFLEALRAYAEAEKGHDAAEFELAKQLFQQTYFELLPYAGSIPPLYFTENDIKDLQKEMMLNVQNKKITSEKNLLKADRCYALCSEMINIRVAPPVAEIPTTQQNYVKACQDLINVQVQQIDSQDFINATEAWVQAANALLAPNTNIDKVCALYDQLVEKYRSLDGNAGKPFYIYPLSQFHGDLRKYRIESNFKEKKREYFAALKEVKSLPAYNDMTVYLNAGIEDKFAAAKDALEKTRMVAVPDPMSNINDLALHFCHTDLNATPYSTEFLKEYAAAIFSEQSWEDTLQRFKPYKDAVEELVKSQYPLRRNNDGDIHWDSVTEADRKRHNEASKQYVAACRQLFRSYIFEVSTELNIFQPLQLLSDRQYYGSHPDNPNKTPQQNLSLNVDLSDYYKTQYPVTFWISPALFHVEENHTFNDLTKKSQQYEAALRVWLLAEAEYDSKPTVQDASNIPFMRAEKLAKQNAINCSRWLRDSPKPDADLSDCVEMAVKLEMQENNPNKNNQWNMILKFAEIKYGPGALLKEFQAQYAEKLKKAKATNFPRFDSGTPRERAFNKAYLIVTGIALIATNIALAILTAGTATPVAALGLCAGCGLIALAIGVTMIGRDKFKTLRFSEAKALKPFVVANEQTNEFKTRLDQDLPSVKKARK